MFHSIACGFCNILWKLEMFEGKDRPAHLPKPKYDDAFVTATSEGAVGGLMMRMTENLWGSGGVCCFDSHFSNLRACIEMKRKGLYSNAYIKMNGTNWPQHSNGAANELYMSAREVPFCSSSSFGGTWAGVPFHVCLFKDTEYVGQMFTTYGSPALKKGRTHKRRHPTAGQPTIHFQHDVNFWAYYFSRASIDINNNIRQGDLGLEAGWGTHNWVTRMFTFYLAVAEVNASIALNYFRNAPEGSPKVTLHNFRKVLAKELCANQRAGVLHAPVPRRRRRNDNSVLQAELEHGRMKKPDFAGRCLGTTRPANAPTNAIVDGDGNYWFPSSQKYQTMPCTYCRTHTREYCACDAMLPLCVAHGAVHRRDVTGAPE
jgi:hypothetical protein